MQFPVNLLVWNVFLFTNVFPVLQTFTLKIILVFFVLILCLTALNAIIKLFALIVKVDFWSILQLDSAIKFLVLIKIVNNALYLFLTVHFVIQDIKIYQEIVFQYVEIILQNLNKVAMMEISWRMMDALHYVKLNIILSVSLIMQPSQAQTATILAK